MREYIILTWESTSHLKDLPELKSIKVMNTAKRDIEQNIPAIVCEYCRHVKDFTKFENTYIYICIKGFRQFLI